MAWIRIAVAALLLALSCVVHILPLLFFAVVRLLLPFRAVRRRFEPVLVGIARSWIGFNNWMIDHLTSTRIAVDGDMPDDRDGRWLVIANHRSWVDIPVLQYLFNGYGGRLPLMRFFLKSQLIWVPLLGLAWWALDFPFMKRYTKEQVERRPELAGRDLEATRRACRKFRDIPVAIMNFVEGTRFSRAKREAQDSPYEFLLKPRSGGVAFVLEAMEGRLRRIVDVTIVYDRERPTLADLFANRLGTIRVNVRRRTVPDVLLGGDYHGDEAFRRQFREWLDGVWQDKDDDYRRLANRDAVS
ncbi:MAG: acyltransferase [Wenzhouxiangellaceae bacterium]|nr:acyltransferase [Wenzhouxiangellaceae bacterium]